MLGMNVLYLASEFERQALSHGGKLAGVALALTLLFGIAWGGRKVPQMRNN